MKPIALIGALITIGVALTVVSKLTAPTTAVETVAPAPVEPTPPPENPTEITPENPEGKPEDAHKDDLNYQQNPFDLKRTGPYPKAVFNDEKHEFGQMPLGQTWKHVFVVKNEGEAPLQLEKGPMQCKCTMPALTNKEIPPGGQADITLEWKPLGVQADFAKEAVIWTNDPSNSRLSLQIAGEIITDDFWEPTESFNLESVSQGQPRTVTGTIMSRTRDDLKIERVDKSSELLVVEYEKAGEELLKEKNAKCGYVVKITVPASDAITLIRETVTVTVNSATNTQIVWQLFGGRVGPISIFGKGWYAEKQLAQLGHFRAAEGISQKYSLLLRERGEADLAITDVKVDGPIQVTLEKDSKWTGKSNERYFLTVNFVPGGNLGQRTQDQPLTVVITTNHPKIPSLNLNVSYDAD